MDRFLPAADESISEQALVAAGPDRAYEALGAAEVSGDRLLGLLGGLADLDDRMAGAGTRPPTLGELLGPKLGFVELEDEPGSRRVVGIVARYSAFDRGLERLASDRFAMFDEPGHVKVVIGLSLAPAGSGRTLVGCDVRVRATDDDTRSALRSSWFLVRPALRLLARRMLELIRSEAERQPVA